MSRRTLASLVPVLFIIVFGANGGIFGPLIPAIAQDFHLRVEQAGWLTNVFFMGALLATTFGGFLADRFGKKLLFCITLALFCTAVGLLAGAPLFVVLAVACLLMGAAGGTMEGLCSAVIADVDPDHLDRNMNLLQVAFNVGAVGAIGLIAWLRLHDVGWRVPYTGMAVAATLVLLLALMMAVPPPAAAAERMSTAVARTVIGDPPIVLLAIAIALYVGSEMSLAWWVSRMLVNTFHYHEAVADISAGLFWLTMGVGRVACGGLAHRFSAYRILRVLVVGGIVSYLVLYLAVGVHLPGFTLAPSAPLMWVGVGLAGLTFSGIWPLIVSLGAAHHPAYTGTAVSVLVSSGTLGGCIVPGIAGVLIERFGTGVGLLLLGGMFVVLFAVLTRYGRHRRVETPLALPDESVSR
jgi:FHS family glucose/mannose:H+ symporter-like MFS transporter